MGCGNWHVEGLERYGYTVLAARRPSQALDLSGRHEEEISLLVTDVVMPEMGGRELAKQLAMTRPDMKVLYTSGYTDDAISHYGVLEPELAFLEKPFTMTALARRVRELLDREQPPGVTL
jgi:DNA-binding NtrC family response regulator